MEANNMKALREAVLDIKSEAETTFEFRDYPIAGDPGERGYCKVVDADYLIDKCNEALAAPPRNCDVGTAEEQEERYEKFCSVHWGSNDRSGNNCGMCPLSPFSCRLAWAQMPYEANATDSRLPT